MEKQLSFNLENYISGEIKNKQHTKRKNQPVSETPRQSQTELILSKLLTTPEKRFKLKPLSWEDEAEEKNFSEASTLKESSLVEQTPEKERLFDNLINVETVAELLGVAPKTIHNWVYLRKIPYVKCGQKVLFRPKSLKAWLNRKEVKSWL